MAYDDFIRRTAPMLGSTLTQTPVPGMTAPVQFTPMPNTQPGSAAQALVAEQDAAVQQSLMQERAAAMVEQSKARLEQRQDSRGGGFFNILGNAVERVRDYPQTVGAAISNVAENPWSPAAWGGAALAAADPLGAALQIPADYWKEAQGEILYRAATGDQQFFDVLGMLMPQQGRLLSPLYNMLNMGLPDDAKEAIIAAHDDPRGYKEFTQGRGVFEVMMGISDDLPPILRYPFRVLFEVANDPMTWTGIGAAGQARGLGQLGRVGRSTEEFNALNRGGKLGAIISDAAATRDPIRAADALARGMSYVPDQLMFGLPAEYGGKLLGKTPLAGLSGASRRLRREQERAQVGDVVQDFAAETEPNLMPVNPVAGVDIGPDGRVTVTDEDLPFGAEQGDALRGDLRLGGAQDTAPMPLDGFDTQIAIAPERGVLQRHTYIEQQTGNVSTIDVLDSGGYRVKPYGQSQWVETKTMAEAIDTIAITVPNAPPTFRSPVGANPSYEQQQRSFAQGAIPADQRPIPGVTTRPFNDGETQMVEYRHGSRGVVYARREQNGYWRLYGEDMEPLLGPDYRTERDAYKVATSQLLEQPYRYQADPFGRPLHPAAAPNPEGDRFIDQSFRATRENPSDERMIWFWDRYREEIAPYVEVLDQEQAQINQNTVGQLRRDLAPGDPEIAERGARTVDTPAKSIAEANIAATSENLTSAIYGEKMATTMRGWREDPSGQIFRWKRAGGGTKGGPRGEVFRTGFMVSQAIKEALLTDNEAAAAEIIDYFRHHHRRGTILSEEQAVKLLLPGAQMRPNVRRDKTTRSIADVLEANRQVRRQRNAAGQSVPTAALPAGEPAAVRPVPQVQRISEPTTMLGRSEDRYISEIAPRYRSAPAEIAPVKTLESMDVLREDAAQIADDLDADREMANEFAVRWRESGNTDTDAERQMYLYAEAAKASREAAKYAREAVLKKTSGIQRRTLWAKVLHARGERDRLLAGGATPSQVGDLPPMTETVTESRFVPPAAPRIDTPQAMAPLGMSRPTGFREAPTPTAAPGVVEPLGMSTPGKRLPKDLLRQPKPVPEAAPVIPEAAPAVPEPVSTLPPAPANKDLPKLSDLPDVEDDEGLLRLAKRTLMRSGDKEDKVYDQVLAKVRGSRDKLDERLQGTARRYFSAPQRADALRQELMVAHGKRLTEEVKKLRKATGKAERSQLWADVQRLQREYDEIANAPDADVFDVMQRLEAAPVEAPPVTPEVVPEPAAPDPAGEWVDPNITDAIEAARRGTIDVDIAAMQKRIGELEYDEERGLKGIDAWADLDYNVERYDELTPYAQNMVDEAVRERDELRDRLSMFEQARDGRLQQIVGEPEPTFSMPEAAPPLNVGVSRFTPTEDLPEPEVPGVDLTPQQRGAQTRRINRMRTMPGIAPDAQPYQPLEVGEGGRAVPGYDERFDVERVVEPDAGLLENQPPPLNAGAEQIKPMGSLPWDRTASPVSYIEAPSPRNPPQQTIVSDAPLTKRVTVKPPGSLNRPQDLWRQVIDGTDDESAAALDTLVYEIARGDVARTAPAAEATGVDDALSETGSYILRNEADGTPAVQIKKVAGELIVIAPGGSDDPLVRNIVARAEGIPVRVEQGWGDAVGRPMGLDTPSSNSPDPLWDPVYRLHRMAVIDDTERDLLSEVVKISRGKKARQMRVADLYLLNRSQSETMQEAIEKTVKTVMDARDVVARGERRQAMKPGVLRKLLEKYDALTDNIRERLMFNPYTGPVATFLDQVGDTARMLMEGEYGAVRRSWKWRNWRGGIRAAQGENDYLMATDGGKFLAGLGEDVPTELAPSIGREGLDRHRGMTFDRVIGEAISDVRGQKLAKASLAAVGARGSNFILELRTGGDITRRFSVMVEEMVRGLPKAREALFTEAKAVAARRPQFDVRAFQRELGEVFSQRDVITAARTHGLDDGQATHLAREWRKQTRALKKQGVERSKKVLFSYEQTELDQIMRRVFLFHYWYTRASVTYTRSILRNPYLYANYTRMTEGIERTSEGQPASVKGMIKAFTGPGGYTLFLDPLKAVSTAVTFSRKAFEDGDETAFDEFLSDTGLFFNPMLASAAAVLGMTQNEYIDPLATFQLRRVGGSVLNAINAETGWEVGPLNGGQYLGTPFQNFIAKAVEELSGALPGIDPNYARDGGAHDKVMIRNGIMDKIMARHDITSGTDLGLWPTEAIAELQEAYDAFDEGRPNPDADAAYRDWARGNLARTATTTTLPVTASLRSTTRDARMVGARSGRNAFDDERNITTAAPGLSTDLTIQDARFDSLFPSSAAGRMSTSPLTGQTQGEVLSDPTMAEYNQYRDWKGQARDMGVAQFREQMRQVSPSYARYIAEMERELGDEMRGDPDYYDNVSISYQAYLAASGQRRDQYESGPPPATDVSRIPASSLLFGGTGATGQPSQQGDLASTITGQLIGYQQQQAEFNRIVQDSFGQEVVFDLLSPQGQAYIRGQLAPMGIRIPSIGEEAAGYQAWSRSQPVGTDISIDAYVRWLQGRIATGQSTRATPMMARM
jgi:hypothetical protein